MNATASVITAFEGAPLPDPFRRAAVNLLVAGARRGLSGAPAGVDAAFAREMASRPIAEHTQAANDQHYELPPAFFEHVLGPRLKYSSCLYPTGTETLAEAEALALIETCDHAGLADGQDILELGCGWGSLSLWMAARYPQARITVVSNARPQRAYIEAEAQRRGLTNLTVITADMNHFDPGARFDRVVSVEMFEHMSNWRDLLGRVRSWLAPNGRAFLHVFSHRTTPYSFETADTSDWIAQHFFTGGIMPSHDMIRAYPDLFTVEAEWRWDGTHYQRTALDWLANFDANRPAINAILHTVYGDQAGKWARRWRIFFLATAGLFGHAGGQEWAVSHYRLAPS